MFGCIFNLQMSAANRCCKVMLRIDIAIGSWALVLKTDDALKVWIGRMPSTARGEERGKRGVWGAASLPVRMPSNAGAGAGKVGDSSRPPEG